MAISPSVCHSFCTLVGPYTIFAYVSVFYNIIELFYHVSTKCIYKISNMSIFRRWSFHSFRQLILKCFFRTNHLKSCVWHLIQKEDGCVHYLTHPLPKNPHRRKINGFSERWGYMKVHECKKGTVYNEFGYCKHRLQPANCFLGKEKHFWLFKNFTAFPFWTIIPISTNFFYISVFLK